MAPIYNLKNISLSLCLGLFGFHLYVVDQYELKQEDLQRSPASVTCVRVTSDREVLTAGSVPSAQNSSCEYKVEESGSQCVITLNNNGNFMRVSTPTQGECAFGADAVNTQVSNMLSGSAVTIETQAASTEDVVAEDTAAAEAVTEVTDATEGAEGTLEVVEATAEATTTEATELASSDGAPAITPPADATEDAAGDDEYVALFSEDEVRDILDDLKTLGQEVEACQYDPKVYKSVARAYRRIRNVRRFEEDRKDYEDLQERDFEALEELEDLIAEARDEELSATDRASCLADQALALESNSREQYEFFQSELRPLLEDSEMSGAIGAERMSRLVQENRFIRFSSMLNSALAEKAQQYQQSIALRDQELSQIQDPALRAQREDYYRGLEQNFISQMQTELSTLEQGCILNNQGRSCPMGALVQSPEDIAVLQGILNDSKLQWSTQLPLNGAGAAQTVFGQPVQPLESDSAQGATTPPEQAPLTTSGGDSRLQALIERVQALRAQLSANTNLDAPGNSRAFRPRPAQTNNCGNNGFVPTEGCRVTDFSTPALDPGAAAGIQ